MRKAIGENHTYEQLRPPPRVAVIAAAPATQKIQVKKRLLKVSGEVRGIEKVALTKRHGFQRWRR